MHNLVFQFPVAQTRITLNVSTSSVARYFHSFMHPHVARHLSYCLPARVFRSFIKPCRNRPAQRPLSPTILLSRENILRYAKRHPRTTTTRTLQSRFRYLRRARPCSTTSSRYTLVSRRVSACGATRPIACTMTSSYTQMIGTRWRVSGSHCLSCLRRVRTRDTRS